MRILRPHPTAAFGSRDRFLPGFSAAVEAARSHGFAPALRGLGGRVAAYHRGSLVVEHVEPAGADRTAQTARFERFSAFLAEALRGLGVDAHVGEIPGEYCPGEHSIHAGGEIKIVGTAQRIAAQAWLFSSVLVVEDPDPIRAVLTDVQAALGVEWEPRTAGGMSELTPGITVEAVAAAVEAAYRAEWTLDDDALTDDDVAAAAALTPPHRL